MLCYIGICLFVSVLLTTVNGVMDAEARITSVDRVSALAAQRSVTKVLWVKNGGPWGTWSRPEFCAKGYYASGFSLKIEGKQGKGDDTALNAIRLKCRKGNNSPNTGGTIWAHEGRWGQWSRTMNCPSGKRFVGFRLQVEARQEMLCYIDICLFVSVLLTASNGPTDVEAQINSKVVASATAAQRILTKVLSVANGGPWGTWSGPEFCAKGYYATGYSLKIEEKQGKGDDTALNAIRLKCRKGNNSPSTGGTILAQEGPWGEWWSSIDCPIGEQFVGFRLQVEASQGRGDDTAANYVRFRCRSFNGGATHEIGTIGFWGDFGAWSQTCPLGSAICGLGVRIEPKQGRRDDTALNDAKFYCCSQ